MIRFEAELGIKKDREEGKKIGHKSLIFTITYYKEKNIMVHKWS